MIINLQTYKNIVLNDAKNIILLDFIKAEDYANSNQEGSIIIDMKFKSSLFIPSILQFIASAIALFPLYRRPPKFYMVFKNFCLINKKKVQILKLVFSSIAIILWMESIYLAILSINLQNVQLNFDRFYYLYSNNFEKIKKISIVINYI